MSVDGRGKGREERKREKGPFRDKSMLKKGSCPRAGGKKEKKIRRGMLTRVRWFKQKPKKGGCEEIGKEIIGCQNRSGTAVIRWRKSQG